jgi:DNA-binding response OmpR family regulator
MMTNPKILVINDEQNIITKSFSPRELVARIKAGLRRYDHHSGGVSWFTSGQNRMHAAVTPPR